MYHFILMWFYLSAFAFLTVMLVSNLNKQTNKQTNKNQLLRSMFPFVLFQKSSVSVPAFYFFTVSHRCLTWYKVKSHIMIMHEWKKKTLLPNTIYGINKPPIVYFPVLPCEVQAVPCKKGGKTLGVRGGGGNYETMAQQINWASFTRVHRDWSSHRGIHLGLYQVLCLYVIWLLAWSFVGLVKMEVDVFPTRLPALNISFLLLDFCVQPQ